MDSAGLGLRWSRAALLATVALVCGVVAHAAAGGPLPGTPALAGLWGVGVLVAGCLLGRPASTRRIVVLLVGGQTLLHAALMTMAGHGTAQVAGHGAASHLSAAGMASMSHHPPGPSLPDRLDTVGHALAMSLTGPQPVMALAHLAAATVAGLWLAVGERTLWSLLALVSAGVRHAAMSAVAAWASAGHSGLLAVVPPAVARAHLDVPLVTDSGRELFARSHGRRGPPGLRAA